MESRNTTEWSSKTIELTYLFRYPFPIAEFIIKTQPDPKILEKLLVYSMAITASAMGFCAFLPLTSITIPMDVMDLANKQNKKNPHHFFSKEIDVAPTAEVRNLKIKSNLS